MATDAAADDKRKPHIRAFYRYLRLGTGRSLHKLENTTPWTFEQLQEWSLRFAWDEKIAERERDRKRARGQLYDKRLMKIQDRVMGALDATLGQFNESSIGVPITIRNAADLRNVAQAYESIARAQATLAQVNLQEERDGAKTIMDLLESMGEEDFSDSDDDTPAAT